MYLTLRWRSHWSSAALRSNGLAVATDVAGCRLGAAVRRCAFFIPAPTATPPPAPTAPATAFASLTLAIRTRTSFRTGSLIGAGLLRLPSRALPCLLPGLLL